MGNPKKVGMSRAAVNECLAQDWPVYDPDLPCLPDDPGLPPSIRKARKDLNAAILEGSSCPVCGRRVQVYENTFRWNLALLAQHVRRDLDGPFQWFHLPTTVLQIPGLQLPARAASRLAGSCTEGWRIFERADDGLWRLTLTGLLFVDQKLWIPSSMYTYNNRVVGYGKELIGFSEDGVVRFDPEDL